MQVIENVVVVCRSFGEKNVMIVENENLGIQMSLENPKGIEVELGTEGKVIYKEGSTNQLVSFEPIMVEELV